MKITGDLTNLRTVIVILAVQMFFNGLYTNSVLHNILVEIVKLQRLLSFSLQYFFEENKLLQYILVWGRCQYFSIFDICSNNIIIDTFSSVSLYKTKLSKKKL
jgi:hypothetical protein